MRFYLRPLGVRQYKSIHPKREAHSRSEGNPKSPQTLGWTGPVRTGETPLDALARRVGEYKGFRIAGALRVRPSYAQANIIREWPE